MAARPEQDHAEQIPEFSHNDGEDEANHKIDETGEEYIAPSAGQSPL